MDTVIAHSRVSRIAAPGSTHKICPQCDSADISIERSSTTLLGGGPRGRGRSHEARGLRIRDPRRGVGDGLLGVAAMKTVEQMTSVVTQHVKDLNRELVRDAGVTVEVLAGSIFGLGVTMLFESGSSEEEIVAIVRKIVGDLTGTPSERGAS